MLQKNDDPRVPEIAAALAQLTYANDAEPGIRRRRVGKGFCYYLPDGSRLCDKDAIRRIEQEKASRARGSEAAPKPKSSASRPQSIIERLRAQEREQKREPGSTKGELLAWLRNTDERWARVGEWTVQEALEWGLVTEVRPADEVEDRARELAARLAAGPTEAFGRMKKLLRSALSSDLLAQSNAEVEQMAASGASDDAAEAVPAFAARRRPTFTGH